MKLKKRTQLSSHSGESKPGGGATGARATAQKAVALILAAGSGERLGYLSDDRSLVAKALVPCAGRPLLAWSLLAFSDSTVSAAVIAAPADALDSVRDVVADHCPDGFSVIVTAGGDSRSRSVQLALAAAGAIGQFGIVAVHDAARPLVQAAAIDAGIRLVIGDERLAGAILAAPVADTIKQVGSDRQIERTLERSLLWAAQTPQIFRIERLAEALDVNDQRLEDATDDASLVEAAGGNVVVLDSDGPNFKVTTSGDLRLAEQLLAARLSDSPASRRVLPAG